MCARARTFDGTGVISLSLGVWDGSGVRVHGAVCHTGASSCGMSVCARDRRLHMALSLRVGVTSVGQSARTMDGDQGHEHCLAKNARELCRVREL